MHISQEVNLLFMVVQLLSFTEKNLKNIISFVYYVCYQSIENWRLRCYLNIRYCEYIIVQDLKHLVKVPDHVSLSVAAMLPTGALLAMNTVIHAREYTDQLLKERGDSNGKENQIFL